MGESSRLYMVVERFRDGSLDAVGERFARDGRMLPPGVEYIDSWMTTAGDRCFQLMRAPDRSALDAWIARWIDLVEFESTEVAPSAAFWSARA